MSKTKDQPKTTRVTIIVPKGCDRDALSVDALDARTRELANATHVFVGDDLLLCRSFKVKTRPDGERVCLLEVREECFEIVEMSVPKFSQGGII